MKPMSVVFSAAVMILSSTAFSEESCFHGWLPTDLTDSVTGFCWNRRTDPDVSTDIQIEAGSQKINIRGVLGWGQDSRYEYFDYTTESCADASETVTVVEGHNNRQEAFRMTFEKNLYPSIPETDYVAGQARIELTLSGQKYDLSMPCWKHGGEQ